MIFNAKSTGFFLDFIDFLNENLREENDRDFGEVKLADFAMSRVTRMGKPRIIEIRRFN